MSRGRALRLAGVGSAAGLFSGLFGVGGGIVIVPLLVLWLGAGEREATGTSLVAIVIVASLAATLQALYGNVDLELGLLLGIPAGAGAVAGTWLQQRLPSKAISLLFGVLLVAVAAELVIP